MGPAFAIPSRLSPGNTGKPRWEKRGLPDFVLYRIHRSFHRGFLLKYHAVPEGLMAQLAYTLLQREPTERAI